MQTRVDETNENTSLIEVELSVEELEEVIAPKLAVNHNQTLAAELGLSAKELAAFTAPRRNLKL